ncbi:MAG: rRNA adenine N-6-methyltransferase family protein [Patescibacteria group bacterium]
MAIFITFIFFIIVIIFLFSSPSLSPIPYFPSQPVDLPLIIKALNLKNNQTVIDLGAGDGIVIFKAAKKAFQQKLNTKFIAVEINPVLILILHVRRLFHKNKKNIKVIYGDIFTMDFDKLLTFNFSLLTFYVYISPWFLEKTISNIKDQSFDFTQDDPERSRMGQISNFSVISYMYPIKSLMKTQKIIQGKNKIFAYQ